MDNRYGLLALTRILEDCSGKTLHMESVEVRPWDPAICRATVWPTLGLDQLGGWRCACPMYAAKLAVTDLSFNGPLGLDLF